MLNISEYQNAILIPDNTRDAFNMRGGIYTQDGKIIDASLLNRYQTQRITASAWQPPKQILNGDYVFGGYLFNHYGHAIIETLSRLWYSIYAEKPFIYIPSHKHITGFTQLHHDMLDLLNISNRLYIETPTQIEKIIIPSAGLVIPDLAEIKHIDFLAKFDAAKHSMKNKLWISRSSYMQSYSSDRYTENKQFQKTIENKLKADGWIIFNCHEFSLKKQLQTICESYIVAGFESSAFHSLLLLKNYKGKIIMFNRGRTIPKIHFEIKKLKSLNWQIQNFYPLYHICEYLYAECRKN